MKGYRLVLAITGGIAAYKAPELVRRLRALGFSLEVVLTAQAERFVTAHALQAVLGKPVYTANDEGPTGMRHIELAKWAQAILVAPVTANRLAVLANGFADDLLSNMVLATTAPVWLCPAMNQAMWQAPQTQANLEKIKGIGAQIWGPGIGSQACGDFGPGRMIEPEEIVAKVQSQLVAPVLKDRHVLITAGPTREPIDPVRFLSNRSSGKMGFALAEAARDAGARVTLIAGPVHLETPSNIERVDVHTAQQMFEAVVEHISDCDIFCGVAAVADYTLAEPANHKIKKQEEHLQLTLTKTVDILAHVASHPNPPFCVGFAAETQDEERYAQEKRASKGVDLIALNCVSDTNIGFDSAENALTIYGQERRWVLSQAHKATIARQFIEIIGEVAYGQLESQNFR